MSFFGTLLGGVGGFLLGGPSGAAIGAGLGGAIDASNAASQAASTSNAAQQAALDLQKRMYEEGVARRKVYGDIGLEFTNRLAGMLRGGPEAAQQFLQMDPGYGFRMSEGLKALDRQAAARGGLISGGALKAAQRYGQDVASQEFGNAFNRYGQFAALGPSSADITNELGRQYSQQASGTYGQMGDTAANALLAGQGLRQSSYGGMANLLGRMYPQGMATAGMGMPSVIPNTVPDITERNW